MALELKKETRAGEKDLSHQPCEFLGTTDAGGASSPRLLLHLGRRISGLEFWSILCDSTVQR